MALKAPALSARLACYDGRIATRIYLARSRSTARSASASKTWSRPLISKDLTRVRA
jgi:hypothetical protein